MCGNIWLRKDVNCKGHGEAIVPHLVEFQANDRSGLVIQFYDYDRGLVHTYRDPSIEFKCNITIQDAPKQTTVWSVIGVDVDNWWHEYAPGMDCMRNFVPGPCYDPSAQVNVLCTGRQVDDAMCSYLFDVAKARQQNSNAVIFIDETVELSQSVGHLRMILHLVPLSFAKNPGLPKITTWRQRRRRLPQNTRELDNQYGVNAIMLLQPFFAEETSPIKHLRQYGCLRVGEARLNE